MLPTKLKLNLSNINTRVALKGVQLTQVSL